MTGIQHNRPDGTECLSLAVTSCRECGWTEPVRDGGASPSVADGLPPGHVLVSREDLQMFFAALGHTRTFRQNTAPGEAEDRLRAAAETTP